jgi:hypothetical protein
MSAAQIIQEIQALPPDEKDSVVKFVIKLGMNQPLSPENLGNLASKLAGEADDAKASAITEESIRGFYGLQTHA